MRLLVAAVLVGSTALVRVAAAPPLAPEEVAVVRQSGQAGDAEAQLLAGHAHEVGDGVAQDFALAESWYRRAAETGNVEAQSALGLLLARDGTGLRNPVEAARWLRLAAERGDRGAQFALGCLLANGEGVARSASAAAAWFRRAAGLGDADASLIAGRLFPHDARRDGTPAAYHRAGLAGLRLDRAAAEFLRGYVAETGWDAVRDVAAAARHYRAAADAGQPDAQFRLARLHLDGRWLARDAVTAFMLFDAAAQQGHASAASYRSMLARTLDAAQRDTASVRLYQSRVFPAQPAARGGGATAAAATATLARDQARPE